MVGEGIHGRWHEVSHKLYRRGLIGDLLNAPGNIISQVLSPPAATTQESVKAEGTPAAAATTQAAAAQPTTQAAVAAPATTQQPAAAAPASSTKQEQQQQQPVTTPAAQVPATTKAAAAAQPQQSSPAAAVPSPSASSSAAAAAAGGGTTSVANAAAAAAAPTNPVVAASSHVAASSSISPTTKVSGLSGADATSSGGPAASQTPISPNLDTQSSGGTPSQTPLVATGVVLGIVVLMGISLLLYWCYRRRRRANKHHHAALPPESPSNEYGPEPRYRDTIDTSVVPMTEVMTDSRAVSGIDQLTVEHPKPERSSAAPPQLTLQGLSSVSERTNPYSGTPFTYAQAQQYAQSHGFSFPVPPPIPEPSPIRIFRWPTRSSRSGSSARSVWSAWRTSKTPSHAQSRAQSRASRSTMSSMLWHGRRDVIARRTMNQTPVSTKNGFLAASTPDSPMPEGLHTPILDWLNWIRGNQSENGDPEFNHRKSIASSESSLSEVGSIASSGVFSPTLLSWPPPAEGAPPMIDPDALEALRYLPMPLQLKRESSNGETFVEPSGSRVQSFQ
ncbi:hypothetical protein CCHR01_04545 [Colletotrichum chrysophilum]|nr:hypothetical protein CCHR01_04545 [Colletotrichum chrysophilum]